MKLFKKVLPLYILVFITLLTSAMGGVKYKYTPIMIDDGINIMVPYASVSASTYTPPANSLGHTTITTTKGKKIRVDKIPDGLVFEGYVGKIVLLEIYASTCPHCIDAIPAYNRVKAKYPKDVYVITIESSGLLNNAELQQFVNQNNIQYATVARENRGSMFSFIQSLTTYYFQAVPYLMILDRDGDIVYDKILADFPESTINGIIQGLL